MCICWKVDVISDKCAESFGKLIAIFCDNCVCRLVDAIEYKKFDCLYFCVVSSLLVFVRFACFSAWWTRLVMLTVFISWAKVV